MARCGTSAASQKLVNESFQSRRGTVIKDMAKVAVAFAAQHLDAFHEQAGV